MGSLVADSEEKQEMDDSGCVQDDSSPVKEAPPHRVALLDLSDDVLLLIMMNLSPRDLKALGFACERLGALVLDRTLWVHTDARAHPLTDARLRWYLDHALHPGTSQLLVSGYAWEADLWLSKAQKEREEKEKAAKEKQNSEHNNNGATDGEGANNSGQRSRCPSMRECVSQCVCLSVTNTLSGAGLAPSTIEREGSPEMLKWPPSDGSVPGPQLTVTPCLLRQLGETCPKLTSLALDYCNINCSTTSINQFPPTLKKLSLRGSRCYNHPLNRSFLFKIQDYLPNLETLDVCECDWMEPASFLPLSKLPGLRHLYMRDCYRLTEFVAYASLATRYGFLKLQTLDLRGSPVGDSEVSALGWLLALRRLWLSPARAAVTRDVCQQTEPLPDLWEDQEPEYYKNKPPRDFSKENAIGACDSDDDDDLDDKPDDKDDRASKRKPSSTDEPGPSKRKRDDKVNNGASTSKDEPEQDKEALPKHHVLYVNVGQQVHAVYRLSLDTDHIFCRNPYLRRTDPNQVFLSPAPHLDASKLVTDSAIRRFGRADGEDINYVHIGPNGPFEAGALGHRPNRSNLRHLSITGFRYITDHSLIHLATAAPQLEFIDFSETNVTEQGVETFKSLRPDCEVVYSPFVERKE
ncbi:uncharacterized protein isoform X3 [Choristoneura fumiferana]|uniref:uncharacterized protein isoform X3 n=1 Tax=Choristoneura fumiferana TaxID=7141 RepID=UPI003D15366C